jgi:hypothetical protein
VASPTGTGNQLNAGGTAGNDDGYYNSLIAAAIIASFALVALLIVTGLYLKRTTTYKAIISGSGGPADKLKSGSSQSKYDDLQVTVLSLFSLFDSGTMVHSSF